MFESNIFDFDTDGVKRLSEIEVCCDEGAIRAEIFLDGASHADAVADFDGVRHKRHMRRLNSHRFADARVRISATGEQRQLIHSMKIKVR